MTRPGIGEKRFSANKFHPLVDDHFNMANPNDATIDIPLTTVPSRGTGARKTNTNTLGPQHSYANGGGVNDDGEKRNIRLGPGRRKKTGSGQLSVQEEGADGSLNTMGRIYFAVLNFSVITRYFIYVSPLAALIAVPIVVGATISKEAAIGGVRIVWFFTWVEVVWIGLWGSKIVAHFLPFLFQFFAGFVSPGTKKYALVLRALEIPLSLVGWAVVSLATFIPIMTQNPSQRALNDTGEKKWEATVKQILFALFICTLIFVAEKTLIQLISVSYHRKQYDMRIKESKHNVDLLGHLYDASRAMFPEYCKEFAEEDGIISATILAAKKKGHKRGDSVTPLRLIRNVGRNVGRVGDKVTAAFGNVAHEITGKNIFDTGSAHSIVSQALDKRHASEALAKRIWMSFVIEGRDALYEEDIVEVMGVEREAEARECFHILDRDGNGDVSMDEMILTVAEFGRVRKSIARSMHDVDQAIHVLDTLLLTAAMIIMILVFVSFVTTGAATVIAAGATSLLSLSFVFATTAQEVLGSCIFLFVKHPFDVGDRVQINLQELFVEEISLLYTVFRTVSEQRITQVANNVLNTAWIDNVTRSKAMRERISLFVDFGTKFADIQLLKMEMEKFVRDKENSRDFQPDIDIEVISVGNMDKLELRVEIRHKSNWSNETVRAARRSKFMCALVLAIRKVPINGPGGGGAALGDPSNPSYSVSITDELAQSYREKAAQKKEAARLVPTSALNELQSTLSPTSAVNSTGIDVFTATTTTTTSSGAAANLLRRTSGSVRKMSEADFVGALNSRPAGYDLARADESNQLYRVPSANSEHHNNNQLSPGGFDSHNNNNNNNDQTSVLRAPSTGRRKEQVPTLHQPQPPPQPTSPLLMPPAMGVSASAAASASGADSISGASAAPTDRYEIPSYYSAIPQSSATGSPYDAPYESNNPFGANYDPTSPTASSSAARRPLPPQYQSPPSVSAAPGGGAAAAAGAARPAGNAFSSQQRQ